MNTNNNVARKEKLKPIGLCRLWKEASIGKNQGIQIEETKCELIKNLTILQGVSDPVEGLKYLEEAEKYIKTAKILLKQMKERQKDLYEEIDPQMQREQTIAESQFDEMLEYISGLRVMVKIAVESMIQGSTIGKWGDLITWFNFDSPAMELSVTEETIEQKDWKVIIIQDPKCRYRDDLPANIIKRHQGIKDLFERMGGKYYYQAAPSIGTKIILMLPSNN